MLKLIKAKPAVFTEISNNQRSLFKDKIKDLDIILLAHYSGVKTKDIAIDMMKPYFLTMGTEDEETFKVEYVITHNMLRDSKVKIYDTTEEKKQFKEKYYKLEYMFLTEDDWLYGNKEACNSLSKIKDVETIKQLIEKINKIQGNLKLDHKIFYANMHPELQVNLELLEDTKLIYGLKFSDLVESLQYNKKVAIQFIGKDNGLIPKEFFNDINFSLEFAKCLDNRIVKIEEAPIFISKFFDNQEVYSNYHDYLKKYITMNGIKELLDKKESSNQKKIKI